MDLKDYIQGKRHGKEANELERKALNDAFLQDALDGFDAVKGDHLPVIETLEKRITAPQTAKKTTPVWRWMVAAIAFLLIGTSLLEFFNSTKKDFPQTAVVVKPKNETQAEKTKDSVMVADNTPRKSSGKESNILTQRMVSNKNIVTPVALKDTSDGVQVTGYSQNVKSNSDYIAPAISIKSDELSYGNRIDSSNDVLGFNPASNGEFDKKALQGKVAGLRVHTEQENTFWLKNDSVKTEPALSGKLAKADINKESNYSQGKAKGVDIQNSKELNNNKKNNSDTNIRIRGMGSVTNITPLKTTKGRILDENGEPVIGASVMIKGTSKGTSSNLNGDFTLPLIDVGKDSLLVVSYVGYDKQEIPIQQNVGDVKLLADNKSLNEVVIIGYGSVKKSHTTGFVSAVSENKYIFSKKEFINYFKLNYDKNICSGQKINIKATVKLDENGHPTDITNIETNCPEMESELKKWLENSPRWTKKNKTVTMQILIK